jgi:hypothetical protein
MDQNSITLLIYELLLKKPGRSFRMSEIIQDVEIKNRSELQCERKQSFMVGDPKGDLRIE